MNTISKREKQILDLIANEHTIKDIASLLYISIETVKSHRKNLLFKLRAKNTAGMIRRAFELEIIQLQFNLSN